MFSDSASSSESYYPYSEDLQRLMEYGAKIKIHPIYVIGLERDQLHALRNAYSNPDSILRVGIYGIYDTDVLATRLGIEPTVIILAEHVRIQDEISTFIKRFRTPVLRLMKYPIHLHQLCHEDYYGGVYETMDASRITCSEEVTYMLNLGILIWLRNHGERADSQRRDLNLSGAESHEIDMRSTAAVRRSSVFGSIPPKPEPSWTDFVSKQMNGYTPDSDYDASVKKLDGKLDFGNTDSSFDTQS